MTVAVMHTGDPAVVLGTAGRFLTSRPVHHNLVLTLLHGRVAAPIPGHYWMASDGVYRAIGYRAVAEGLRYRFG